MDSPSFVYFIFCHCFSLGRIHKAGADKVQVSKGYTRHLAHQVTICLRGMLIGAIYEKMFSLSYEALAENSAVTLMSTDLNGLQRIIPLFHDMWASVFELGIGLSILGSIYGTPCLLLVVPSTSKYKILTKHLMRYRNKAHTKSWQ